jgi:hypothetical protein
MSRGFCIFVLAVAFAHAVADDEDDVLVREIGARLNDAIARYSESQDSFHAIADRFSNQPKLVGLGLSFYDNRRVESCADEGDEEVYKEVCAVIHDDTTRSEYLRMGVDRIRRSDYRILFEAMELSDFGTDFFVTYEYTNEPEQETFPCEQLEKPRGLDSCTYDLGDGRRINVGWSDLDLEPSAQ